MVFMTTVCGFLNRCQTGPWSVTTKRKRSDQDMMDHILRIIYEGVSAGRGKFVLGCCMVGAVASQVHSGEATVSDKLESQDLTGFTTCEYKADQWTKKCKNLCAPITCRQRSKLGLLWQNQSDFFSFKLS